MIKFNFANAFLHFRRTEGPAGFTWKYLLSNAVANLLMLVLLVAATGAFSGSLFRVFNGTTPQRSTLYVMGFYVLLLLFGGLFMAVFEGSYLRRYMRRDGFKLRIGKDELRLFAVYFIWGLFATVMYIGVIAVAYVGAEVNDVLAVFAVLIALAVWMFLAIRFSAAAALTIRDQKIRFASSWRVTKGRFWVLCGAYLVWFVILSAVYLVVSGLLVTFYMNGFGSFSSAAAQGGMFIALFSLGFLSSSVAMGYFYNIWAGPAALAARTDPDYAGYDDPAEVFT